MRASRGMPCHGHGLWASFVFFRGMACARGAGMNKPHVNLTEHPVIFFLLLEDHLKLHLKQSPCMTLVLSHSWGSHMHDILFSIENSLSCRAEHSHLRSHLRLGPFPLSHLGMVTGTRVPSHPLCKLSSLHPQTSGVSPHCRGPHMSSFLNSGVTGP